MQEVLIRPAQETEAAAINEFIGRMRAVTYQGLTPGLDEAWAQREVAAMREPRAIDNTAQKIREAAEHPDRELFLVATAANGLSGVINAFRYDDLQSIEKFFVDPLIQRRRIGTQLMGRFLDWHDPQIPTTLRIARNNSRAEFFYRLHGFTYVPGWEGMRGEVPVHKMVRAATARAQAVSA